MLCYVLATDGAWLCLSFSGSHDTNTLNIERGVASSFSPVGSILTPVHSVFHGDFAVTVPISQRLW
jgi:hypothetical protein